MCSKLELKVPPPFVMLLLVGTVFLFDQLFPFTVFYSLSLPIIASVLCFACGAAISLSGVQEFRRAKTTVNPLKPESSTSLVDSGIYQYTRNPMYLGMLLMLLSSVLYTQNPLGLISLSIFVMYMNRYQIKPEEKALVKLFGDEFKLYAQQVNRWL